MGFADYHFVTHWRIKGPIHIVYDILKDGPHYSQWWKPSYVSSSEITDKSGNQKVVCTVRARLPYTLTFTTELIREKPPHEILVKSTGELIGTGLWKLRQEKDDTCVEFYWDVKATKPLIRCLSFILKPFFKWNHSWVMRNGEVSLQNEVTRRIQ